MGDLLVCDDKTDGVVKRISHEEGGEAISSTVLLLGEHKPGDGATVTFFDAGKEYENPLPEGQAPSFGEGRYLYHEKSR